MTLRALATGLLTLLLAVPAAALFDDETANDAISSAGIQTYPMATETIASGEFSLVPGDIDYVGIGGLLVGDTVTVATMPTGGTAFDVPDTLIGVFASDGTELCENDDAFNSDDLDGLGSLCRLRIGDDGNYYVGVTGFSPVPFDGSHGETGDYLLSVTLTAVPEPAWTLLLGSGVAGLALLDRLRARGASAAGVSAGARAAAASRSGRRRPPR